MKQVSFIIALLFLKQIFTVWNNPVLTGGLAFALLISMMCWKEFQGEQDD